MTIRQTDRSLSRRTALAGLGATGLGAALAAATHPAAAQDTAAKMANHPIVGVWMVTALGPNLAVFSADGTNIQGVPTAQAGPQGVTFTGAQVGVWEPISERGIHFTGVQLQTDVDGNYVGSVTIDGYPVVSEDGQTLVDDSPETTITMRDAAGNVVNIVKPATSGARATGVRMGVGKPGFPEATPMAGTPTA